VTRESPRSAGWYDDETDAALLRYWDGAKWSPHTAPSATDAAAGVAVDEAMEPVGALEPIDVIDEATSVRPRQAPPVDTAALFRDVRSAVLPPPPRPPDEHTTVPLPPESGTEASDRKGCGGHKRVAWIVTGAVVALGLLSTAVSSLVSFSLR
jgi:hypothetical protein